MSSRIALLIQCSVLTFFHAVYGQSRPVEVDLRWKIMDSDTIVYKTLMETTVEEAYDTSELQSAIMDSEYLKKLKAGLEKTDMVSHMMHSSHFEDVIDVQMLRLPSENEKSDGDDIMDDLRSMMTGVMLRGSIHENGEMHSFWLKSTQLNLVSLFFELPAHPVSVGDSWELPSISFIDNDQNFICHEADRENVVKLREIRYENGDTIAVLDYHISEFVKGEYGMNNAFPKALRGWNEEVVDVVNEVTKKRVVTIDYSFSAVAEFSITKGKWLSYNGIISTTSTGNIIGNGRAKYSYSLLEVQNQ